MPFTFADAAGLGMLALIIAMIVFGVTSAIKARHGYAINGSVPLGHVRKIDLLEQENEALRSTVGRLEERLATLERIATDPKKRLTDEIDALR